MLNVFLVQFTEGTDVCATSCMVCQHLFTKLKIHVKKNTKIGSDYLGYAREAEIMIIFVIIWTSHILL